LGATICRALVGAHPGSDRVRRADHARRLDVGAFADKGLSSELVDLVIAMIEEEPSRRPATWEEIIARSRHIPHK
jgi:hypothetical protein